MDHPGAMARCVWDLAVMLQAMEQRVDFSHIDALPPVREPVPPRLGRVRGLFDDLADPAVRSLMAKAEDVLRVNGATVRDTTMPAEFSEVLERHRQVMAVEAAAFHASRLERHPQDYAPNITQLLREGLECPATEYHKAKQLQEHLRSDAVHWFTHCDALLVPATTCPAPAMATTGDPAFNSPWSFTGLPVMSVPAGRSAEGLPLSIQLVGRPFGEHGLLQAAAWCEKVLAQPLLEPPV
jgi:aspartyl-tRNA(Asn)/glutamyl-tRNA(Gln) amidotransferase subunit A